MKTTGLHCLRDNYLSSAMPHIYYLISRNASALSLLTTEFRFTKQSLFKKNKKICTLPEQGRIREWHTSVHRPQSEPYSAQSGTLVKSNVRKSNH